MRRSTVLVLLAAVLLAGAAVRVARFREAAADPAFSFPEVDALYHAFWARGIATGDWRPPPDTEDPRIRSTPYLRPPGYPYFLAAVYRLAGTGPAAPRVVQAVLGLLSCLAGFLLVRRRWGDGPALLYSLLLALAWQLVYFEGELLEPAPLVLLLLVALAALDRWSDGLTVRRAAVAGLLLGIAVLLRPTVALFAALVPLWAWGLPERRRRPGRWAAMMGISAAAALLAVLPALVRNERVGGVLAVSANGGLNLFMGNNELANGTVLDTLPGLGAFGTCFDYPALVRALERREGRTLTAGQVAASFRGRALEFVRENPGRALQLLGHRTLLFWGPREVGGSRQDEIVRTESPVLRRLPGFSFAAAAFFLGLLLAGARRLPAGDRPGAEPAARRLVVLAVLLAVSTYLAHLPFFVAGRYRAPALPALLLVGALGIWAVGSLARRGRRVEAAAWTLLGALLYAALSLNPAGYEPDRARWEFANARARGAAGDVAAARGGYERALAIDPSFSPAHVNLGVLLLDAGELAGAERHFRAALAEIEGAPAWFDLGLALSRQGRRAEAVAAFERAVALAPESPRAHDALGEELERDGDLPGAARHLGEAARLRNDAGALGRIAIALVLSGRGAEAERYLAAAERVDPAAAARARRVLRDSGFAAGAEPLE